MTDPRDVMDPFTRDLYDWHEGAATRPSCRACDKNTLHVHRAHHGRAALGLRYLAERVAELRAELARAMSAVAVMVTNGDEALAVQDVLADALSSDDRRRDDERVVQ